MNYDRITSAFFLICVSLLIVSCASNPYKKINKEYEKNVKDVSAAYLEIPKTKEELNYDTLSITDEWVGTTNFSIRRPNFVIIHHTAQDSLEQTIRTFTLPRTQVSSHYVIAKDGTIVQMLNDYLRSWHAGRGKWGSVTDLNSVSIGIELDNNGFEPFPEAQIESLLILCKRLKWKYGIPTANFIGHSDIAPSRKVDPNRFFPWDQLAMEGYGFWYDVDEVFPVINPKDDQTSIPLENTDTLLKDSFDPIMALRIIGYDVSVPSNAIQSFKLHFVQGEEFSTELTELDLRILKNLYKKYL
ncbi:N-acetylmuramoyl-L-alanine amidase [Algoriphagus machipongonensis]|uniref:N-acetylmuramoyl-L-alanine amidase n=1 Tax=Algoriphagus machipongonensis TaxID=388413 RepID=A3HXI6_9BACT|nr:N-acetylmuramoyl-L-alanine amidase [Algoriphagus machipongonensis]EAZ81309.1 N-acetylmuramoyl-L-alanine amidase [Algoriphagus machipongonensis]